MRKRLFLLLFVVFPLAMSSCKEQEATKPYELEDLVGRWELVSAKLYDREAKFLTDTSPKNEMGCGTLTWVFTADQLEIHTFIGKDEKGHCIEEVIHLSYTLQNSTIHTIDDTGVKEEMLITQLTEDEFTFMTSLPLPLDDKVNAIKYTELRCRRVK
ncbi:lipocalin family protein [Myroides sp. mNGS23_01]|nr:lipocalin family protein [Myroides sp. mNGS23_01]WHT39704.1 lipocalin family protein [Myroides sp. mNGS23_01]